MNCENAENLLLQVQKAFEDIEELINTQPESEGYLAKYLTVFTCGIYEEAIESIINEMTSKFGSTEISNFVENNLTFFRNPKVTTLVALLGKFSNAWAEDITIMSETNRNALNGIVNNKNNIAHGLPCSITYSDIKQYYLDSLPIINKVDELLLS